MPRCNTASPCCVEGMDHLAHGLPAEADPRRDHAHLLAPGAGQDDLGTTEDKGIGRAQGGLQGLTLRIRGNTDEERFCCLHTFQYGDLPTKPPETALAVGPSLLPAPFVPPEQRAQIHLYQGTTLRVVAAIETHETQVL